jgi:hypothetical protein
LAALAALVVTTVAQSDDAAARSAASAEPTKSSDQSRRPDPPMVARYAQLLAEFEAQQAAYRRPATKAKSPREEQVAAERRPRDLILDYSRRMVDLAAAAPDDPAARDALRWVINRPGRVDMQAYGDEFARAAALLVRHHGNDPEAVRVGLTLDNWTTPRRDALLMRFYAAAKGREAKGLARLALAQYLAKKAKEVVYTRSVEGRPKTRIIIGGRVVREVDLIDEQYA